MTNNQNSIHSSIKNNFVIIFFLGIVIWSIFIYIALIKTLKNELISLEKIGATTEVLEQVNHLARELLSQMSGFLILILLGVLVLAWLFSKIFISPIKKFSNAVEAVAKGNLDTKIDTVNLKEFGRLADSFNRMTENLQKITVSRELLLKEIKKREEADMALKEQNNFLHSTINSFKYPFYVVNKDYAVELLNAAAIKKGVTLGGHCYEFTHNRQSPCEGETERCLLRTVLKEKRSVMFEHVHYDSKGDQSFVEVYGDPIFDENDNVVKMIEYSINITERKLAEAKMQDLMRSLKLKNKELDNFCYIVSHDLKEPLRAIYAFARFVETDYSESLEGKGKYYLERIEANALRMQQLIEDILEVSSIGYDYNLLKDVNIRDVVNDVILRFEYLIRQKNAGVVIADNLPVVFCDRVRITEVFANLISNAIKFSDKDIPYLEIGVNEKNDRYEFFIRDNGPGIEKEYFEKIFKIFERLGRREDYEGTGVGLSIVKKIIEMHKGEVWLESQPGKGTIFYFTLPKKNTQPETVL
ncbi:MAG: HAMP domain-containing protein [Candidatus Omnitrophica bacterium]|nr:HAMP domain-containing protein [Candidatus Omnitrophota bacterium]